MTTETRDFITELMADASWTRRLAGSLLGDPSFADDAVQDAWLKTRAQVPADLTDRRTWVRRVLTNTLRSRRRADRRRGARERASVSEGLAVPAPVATPEQMLERLEVHRTLATLVAALEEPGRNVLLLHYYEGLTSAQIAAATGSPAGTVRWRLKSAVDELRSRLDAHYAAEKKDWRRALAPLLPAGSPGVAEAPPVPPAAGRPLVVLAALLGGAAVLLVVLFLAGGGRSGRDVLPVAAAESEPDATGMFGTSGRSPVGRAPAPGSRRPGARPVALAAAAIARPCDDEIGALETDVRAAREALAYYLPPQNVWSENEDKGQNLGAQQAIQPAVARWLDEKGAPRSGRSVDCRHDACIVKVQEAWPPTPPWVHRAPSPAAQAALEDQARDITLDGPRKVSRLFGSDEAATQIWFRLHSPSGAAGKSSPPSFPGQLLPSASRRGRAADEGALTADCRERRGALQSELEKLRSRSVSLVAAPVLFRAEPPNPALSAEMQAPLDRFVRARQAGPEGQRPPPLRSECRGNVCRVSAAEGAVMPEWVLDPLLKDEGFSARVRRNSAHSVNGKVRDGLYVTVLPPPSETTSGEDVLRFFLKQVRSDPAGQLCNQRFPPAGSLTLRFVLPASGEPNEDGVPERVSFRLTGPVAETAYGRCFAEALARLAAAFTPPSGISRAEMSKTVQLPR